MRVNVLVLTGIFVILLLVVRQPWLAGYLLLTVLFSYFATLGATTLFGWLWWGRPLGQLDWRVPFFLFTILVAVGEDYNIFLITRMLQERRQFGAVEGIRRAIAQHRIHDHVLWPHHGRHIRDPDVGGAGNARADRFRTSLRRLARHLCDSPATGARVDSLCLALAGRGRRDAGRDTKSRTAETLRGVIVPFRARAFHATVLSANATLEPLMPNVTSHAQPARRH